MKILDIKDTTPSGQMQTSKVEIRMELSTYDFEPGEKEPWGVRLTNRVFNELTEKALSAWKLIHR